MHKKIIIIMMSLFITMISNVTCVYAIDVWAHSHMISNEWGRCLVNEYVVTDSIQGNGNRFTVRVKQVGDASKNQICIKELEFRQKEGLWCLYVKSSSRDAYTPISIVENKGIVEIFEICKSYSTFITLSPNDVEARKAKYYFDRGTSYYFDSKDYWQSVKCFTQAITLYPKYYDAYIRRARAYESVGCYDEAIADYRYVIDSGNDVYNIARNELRDVLKKK